MSDKVVDSENQLWSVESNGTTNVGFTSAFLTKMEECWHILPSHNKKAKKANSLLCVETNDGLISLDSPCTGDIMFFNDKARDFPDQLLENDIIVVIGNNKNAKLSDDDEAPSPRLRGNQARTISFDELGRNPMPPNLWDAPAAEQPMPPPPPPQATQGNTVTMGLQTFWNMPAPPAEVAQPRPSEDRETMLNAELLVRQRLAELNEREEMRREMMAGVRRTPQINTNAPSGRPRNPRGAR